MIIRLVGAILALGLTLAAFGTPAHGQDRYAAFVANMDTGEVLHARRADASRYPASLTKMMTLYMLFEAVERGELTLQTRMTMSREAASRPPSKLGVAAGGTVTVETAIRALVIRSANDVAAMVGEHLAGSESAFAEAMTARAMELGLSATVFRNASGLPDASQRTTARDMARLAHALYRDFPQYFHYFGERSFRHDGRTYTNHNTLVGRVAGIDGLKTGYIRASGFNVVVTGERDGARLVAVVMGGATAPVRDAHAEELVEAAFSTLDARHQGVLLASLNAPRLSPIREQEILSAELAGLPGPTAMGSSGESAPPVRVVMEDIPDLTRPAAATRVALEEPSLLPVSTPAVSPVRAGWAVQVGAFGSAVVAQARLETVLGLAPELGSGRQVTEAIERDGRTLWRARFDGIEPDMARNVCARLARLNEACFAVSPDA